MVEFIRENPSALARIRAQGEQRARSQDVRMEEQGFRDRYAHETQVGVDRAVRSALGGFKAEGSGPQPQPAGGALRNFHAQGQRAQPVQSGSGIDISQSRTPGINPGGGGNRNQRMISELSKVPGGGAMAMKLYTQDVNVRNKRQEELEDQAWDMLANAKRPTDLDMANSLFNQATGRDMPPQWRTHRAALKAAAVDAAAHQRYPRDVVQRRKFIEVGMTKGLETALRSMAGESVLNKKEQMTPQQVFSMAKAAHTIEDPQTFLKTTDWGAVQNAMTSYGYEAQGRAIMNGGLETEGPRGGMSEAMAHEGAQAEASDQAGYFSTDTTDFKDDGGNRKAFVNRRTLELMGRQQEVPNFADIIRKANGNAAAIPVGTMTKHPQTGEMLKWDGKQWMPMATSNPAAGATDAEGDVRGRTDRLGIPR